MKSEKGRGLLLGLNGRITERQMDEGLSFSGLMENSLIEQQVLARGEVAQDPTSSGSSEKP